METTNMEAGEKNATPIRSDVPDAFEGAARGDGGGSVTSPDDRSDTATTTNTTQTISTPIIKSLLKKPQQPSSNSNSTSNSSTTKNSGSRKSVSFNQTVIVFCEEIEGPSPSDHHEPPPIDYQDHNAPSLLHTQQTDAAFDPPRGYRDGFEGVATKNEARKRPADSKFSRYVKSNPDVVTPSEDDAIVDLVDEKLLSLIDNEAIIDAFNLNYDDLSEEDFPAINYLNSGSGFLCNDAVSDYDTNSESSLSTERKVVVKPPKKSAEISKKNDAREKPNLINESHSEKFRNISNTVQADSTTPQAIKSSATNANHRVDKQQATLTPPNSSSSASSKSLPARMKVTQLDATSLVKRQSAQLPIGLQDLSSGINQQLDNRNNQQHQNESSPREESRSSVNYRSPTTAAQKLAIPTSLPTVGAQIVGNDAAMVRDTSSSSLVYSNIASLPKAKLLPAAPASLIGQSDMRNNAQNRPVSVSAPACHICRVIESNKMHAAPPKPVALKLDDLNVAQDKTHNPPQPVVFNQSCISCRDALIKQTGNFRPVNTEQLQQHINKPLTYQIVYVLDRNGNRVRALSLVKPPPNVDGVPQSSDHTHDNRPGLVRPVKIQAPNSIPISYASSTNQPNVIIPQYRLIRAIPPQQMINNNRRQLPDGQLAPNHNSTIYYMRKPLEAKEMCQLPDYHNHGGSTKAFPDPHEVRRLDGLRAPLNQLQANITKTAGAQDPYRNHHMNISQIRKAEENLRCDDSDDPTFGFSNRPSVKVVATTGSITNQSRLDHTLNYHRNFARSAGNGGVNVLVENFTQTLNRKPIHQTGIMKENLPSTTSLSNLNRILVGQPQPAGLPRSSSGPRADPPVAALAPAVSSATTRGMIAPKIRSWVTSKLKSPKFSIPHSPSDT